MTNWSKSVLATQACIFCALSPVAAESSDQLGSLKYATEVCSDPNVVPDDYSNALPGWSAFEPDTQHMNAYGAGYTLIYSAADGYGLGRAAPAKALSLHDDLAFDMEQRLEGIRDDANAGHIHYFAHESGWRLGLEARQDDRTHSACLFWHDRPDSDVIEYLTTPYMSVGPVQTIGGKYMQLESMVLDLDNTRAPISFDVFVADTASSADAVLPELHPNHFTARAYLLVEFSAFSREGR